MSVISFFTPIHYKSTEEHGLAHGFFPALREVILHHKNSGEYDFISGLREILYNGINGIEDYLCLRRKNVVVIQPDGITATLEKHESSYLRTTLKIISYPILLGPMLIGKLGLRLFFQPKVWFEGTASRVQNEYVLPPSNQGIKTTLSEIMREKKNKVFWLPHPQFVKKDEDRFPERGAPLEAFYTVAKMLKYFTKNELTKSNFGRNEFFHWLNDSGSEMNDFMNPGEDRAIFMNCIDFIYEVLSLNNLVPKEVILKHYQKQVKDESNYYYGFNLALFSNFDAIKGNPNEKPKPGDILIGFENDKPVHILFLTGKNPMTREWKGMGLWNLGIEKPQPSNLELTRLQKNFKVCNSHNSLSFKYCSLEKVLHSLNGRALLH